MLVPQEDENQTAENSESIELQMHSQAQAVVTIFGSDMTRVFTLVGNLSFSISDPL